MAANVGNIPKYLALLERLKQPRAKFEDLDYTSLTQVMQKHMNLKIHQLNQTPIFVQMFYPTITKSSPNSWICASYLVHLLRSILDSLPVLTDDNVLGSLSSRQQHLLITWINLTASMHLASNLEPDMLQNTVLARTITPNTDLSYAVRKEFLGGIVRGLSVMFRHPWLVAVEPIEITLIQYMAALYELTYINPYGQIEHEYYSRLLDELHTVSASKYLKFLMTVKANRALCPEQHERMHRDLMTRLVYPHGYEYLVRNLLPIQLAYGEHVERTLRERSDIVTSICARRGHTLAFYGNVRAQCEEFIGRSLRSKVERLYLGVGLDTINKMYRLPDGGGQRDAIERFVFGELHALHQPGDLLAGRIVLESGQLFESLELARTAFTGPLTYRLPARLLVRWMPLMLQLHAYVSVACDHTARMIVHCLANQPREELGAIVDALLHQQYPADWFALHERIEFVVANPTRTGLTCRVAAGGFVRAYSPEPHLLRILKQSEHNILIYNVFLHLLERVSDCTAADGDADGADVDEPLADVADMETLIKRKFEHRITVISTLSDLMEYKPFHCQFNENPTESLRCMTNLLRKRVARVRAWRAAGDERHKETDDATNLVVLAIVREFVEGLVSWQCDVDFVGVLREYREVSCDANVLQHIRGIMQLLREEVQPEEPESYFEAARILCSATEPHLKVYGLVQLTKLVRAGIDIEVLAKRHTILMIAMDGLKHEESYVFLNCINLLVALVDLLESEVLETMVAEFHLADAPVDYRLKVGEVIVKVAELLGPLNFKYKEILIRCFLVGCSFTDDDLRTSSLSNMATLMRFFSYQVHSFFQELIDITQHVITHDKHVPCRRAAVMMLSHLIFGFDELTQFQEMLLPVYRAFKFVAEHESDHTTLIHARIGLDQLKLKVTEFMMIDQQQMPEIRVFGVNEPKATPGRHKGILEIL